MKQLLLLSFAIYSGTTVAQDCSNVIALSKISSTFVSDQDTVESHATNFCSEYAKGSASTSGTSFGASFKFLSLSFGNSNASTETIASKYCSASNSASARKDSYKQYIESISPNAYSAYEQCLKLSKSDLRFNVNAGSILPNQFSMSVTFASTVEDNKSAAVIASSSDGIACTWIGNQSKLKDIKSGSTAILECKRANQGKPGYVSVVRKDVAFIDPLTLPWPAYDGQGNKIDTMAKLQGRLAQAEDRIALVRSEKGTIAITAKGTRPLDDASQCPTTADAYRGERNGRVNFAGQFSVTPTVQAALTSIDIAGGNPGDSNRLSFYVTSVDPKGFNYTFTTWCITKVFSASAAWLAVSP